tara:strand:- start:135 stop:719 length:585 start_codon:yes stop_codon:yes gene_type:complete
MGTITGTTQHRLDLIRTYNTITPYMVGINGCTALYFDTNGTQVVEYTIDGIKYTTRLVKFIGPNVPGRPEPGTKKFLKNEIPTGTNSININNPINSTKSYIPTVSNTNPNRSFNDILYPTTFEYSISAITETNYFVFKDEVKMGVVFTPKVHEEVFIERQRMSVFESQARMSEIFSLEGLETYNNGYYNVTKTE